MSRFIILAVLAAALAGCSAISGLSGSETKTQTQNVALESTPSGAEVSFADGTSCHTPCALAVPGTNGTYYARFALNGYQPASIPVKVTTNKENWYSGEVTSIDPPRVTAKLEAVAPLKKKNTRHHKKPATAKAQPPASEKPTTVVSAPETETTVAARFPSAPQTPAFLPTPPAR